MIPEYIQRLTPEERIASLRTGLIVGAAREGYRPDAEPSEKRAGPGFAAFLLGAGLSAKGLGHAVSQIPRGIGKGLMAGAHLAASAPGAALKTIGGGSLAVGIPAGLLWHAADKATAKSKDKEEEAMHHVVHYRRLAEQLKDRSAPRRLS